jgi:hypothetical protein
MEISWSFEVYLPDLWMILQMPPRVQMYYHGRGGAELDYGYAGPGREHRA